MKKWIIWTAVATLAVAVIVHIVTLAVIPNLIMQAAMSKMPANVLLKGSKTTAESRSVVRPCPDLVYSIVSYDLSQGPLLFRAQVPVDNYWSVAAYAANSDNFFALNDTQVKSNPVEILLVIKDVSCPDTGKALVVVAPGEKGLLLVRHLLVSDDKLEALVEIQRQASVSMGCPSP